MNISSRCEYAFRAMLELAKHQPAEEPLTATVIAERRAIPEKYLVHILLQLKRAGLVRSVRGAQGGYLLAQEPATISLLDVIAAVDGPILNPLPVGGAGSDDLAGAWEEVATDVAKLLEDVTVKSLLDRTATADMYYI